MSPTDSRAARFQVELKEGPGAQGWALNPRCPGQESLSVRLDGQPVDATWRRTWRQDVCAVTGTQAALGWECDLPPGIWARVAEGQARLEFVMDGQPQAGATWMPDSASLQRWLARRLWVNTGRGATDWRALFETHCDAVKVCGLALSSSEASRFPIGQCEGLRGLSIVGWVADLPVARHVLTLVCGGMAVPCPVRRLSRQDVSSALAWPEEQIGFELELPGALWRRAAEPARNLVCQVMLDGKPWGDAVTLAREDLVECLDTACRLSSARERTRQGLLALEHLLHADLWPTLGRDRQRVAWQLAVAAGVPEWLAQMRAGVVSAAAPRILGVQTPRGWLGAGLQWRWCARAALAWVSWLRRSPLRAGQALRTSLGNDGRGGQVHAWSSWVRMKDAWIMPQSCDGGEASVLRS